MGKLSSTVAVVGAGSMGGAIASGLVVSGVAEPSRVMACDPSQEKLALLGEKGIQTFDDAATMLAADPDVVVLAVKPQVLAVGRLTRTWTSHFRCSVHLARQRSCARTNWTQRVRS